MPGLEAEVFVHHETHLGCGRIGDDGLRLLKRRRERLLADDVDAAFRRLGANRLMRRRRRDDVHEVRLLLVEHLAVVGVTFLEAELRRDLGGLHLVAIAEGDDLDFGNPLPRLVLEVAEVARADANAFESLHSGVRFPEKSVQCKLWHSPVVPVWEASFVLVAESFLLFGGFENVIGFPG